MKLSANDCFFITQSTEIQVILNEIFRFSSTFCLIERFVNEPLKKFCRSDSACFPLQGKFQNVNGAFKKEKVQMVVLPNHRALCTKWTIFEVQHVET